MARGRREAEPVEAARPRPVHEVRLGRVTAAVWANQTEHGLRHSVTLSRLYKDSDGAWQRSDSFGLADLPLVMKVADLALAWMFKQGNDGDVTAA